MREFTGDRWISPAQMASNAEDVSLWWRHYEKLSRSAVARPVRPIRKGLTSRMTICDSSLQWCHMRDMASQITSNSTLCSKIGNWRCNPTQFTPKIIAVPLPADMAIQWRLKNGWKRWKFPFVTWSHNALQFTHNSLQVSPICIWIRQSYSRQHHPNMV